MAMFYTTVYAKYLNTGDPSMMVTLTVMQNWVNKQTYSSQLNSTNVTIKFFLYTFSPVQSVIGI